MTDTMDLSHPTQEPHSTDTAPTADADGLDGRVKPVLDEMDRARLAQRGEFIFRIAVTVLGVGALAVAAGLATVGALGAGLRSLGVVVYVLPPVAGFGLGFWASVPRRRYMADFKQQVLPAIAAALGDFHYDAAGKIGAQRLTGSTLLPSHEVYHSEDLFFGHHKGIEVALAEVKLTREQGSGKDRKTITPFKGLFALLSLQRRISGQTVIRLNAGATANWLGGTFGGLEPYVPEDIAFDSSFKVYTNEKAEARSLLSPALLERLTAMAGHIGGGGLEAAFYEDQFFIMVPSSRDLFEPPSIFTNIAEDSGVARLCGELRDVLSIIDVLRLNEAAGS